jgi:hypothetical protein
MTTDDVTGRARRRLQAASAVLAPLLIIAAAFTMPPGTDILSEDKSVNLAVLATVAAHRDRAAITGVLIMLALMSFLPFIAGLAAAVRERGAWLATLGAAMVMAGCFTAGVVNGFWIFNVKATHPSLAADRDAMARLIGLGHWTGNIYAVLQIIVLPLGWLLLAYALGRSRLVPRWQAVLFGISLPVLLALTDRWAAIGGLLILVVFLQLAPFVARGGPTVSPGIQPTDQPTSVPDLFPHKPRTSR